MAKPGLGNDDGLLIIDRGTQEIAEEYDPCRVQQQILATQVSIAPTVLVNVVEHICNSPTPLDLLRESGDASILVILPNAAVGCPIQVDAVISTLVTRTRLSCSPRRLYTPFSMAWALM